MLKQSSMKTLLGKILLGMVIAGAFFASGAHAGNSYTTHNSAGKPIATFTRADGPESFGTAWKDPGGLLWGKYIADYTNNPLAADQNGIIVNSPATEACAKIGGLLPTALDFEKLASYFELDSNQLLTDQGKKDWYAVFPDMQGHWFWSSTVDPTPGYDVYDAIEFSGDDFSFDYDYRLTSVSVRCVAHTQR
jgi:hypothetical protein